jgi:hypothetical protein
MLTANNVNGGVQILKYELLSGPFDQRTVASRNWLGWQKVCNGSGMKCVANFATSQSAGRLAKPAC